MAPPSFGPLSHPCWVQLRFRRTPFQRSRTHDILAQQGTRSDFSLWNWTPASLPLGRGNNFKDSISIVSHSARLSLSQTFVSSSLFVGLEGLCCASLFCSQFAVFFVFLPLLSRFLPSPYLRFPSVPVTAFELNLVDSTISILFECHCIQRVYRPWPRTDTSGMLGQLCPGLQLLQLV